MNPRVVVAGLAILAGIGFYIYQAYTGAGNQNHYNNSYQGGGGGGDDGFDDSYPKSQYCEDEETKKRRKQLIEEKNRRALECTICLAEMNDNSDNRRLSCGHVFHRKCINKWILSPDNPSTCPICRVRLIEP